MKITQLLTETKGKFEKVGYDTFFIGDNVSDFKRLSDIELINSLLNTFENDKELFGCLESEGTIGKVETLLKDLQVPLDIVVEENKYDWSDLSDDEQKHAELLSDIDYDEILPKKELELYNKFHDYYWE